MTILLPFILALVLGGVGAAGSNLGHNTQQLATTITIKGDDADVPPQCTTICKGPDEVF
jgi:hypothetical protein